MAEWVDCIAAKLLEEVGTTIGAIATESGYSVDMESVIYDVIGSIPRVIYPCSEILFSGIRVESDLSNEQQLIHGTVSIRTFIQRSAAHDTSLAAAKQLLELAADVRTALLSTYSRQQAGTVTLSNFELMLPMTQQLFTLETPADVCGVMTGFDFQYTAKFTER